MQTIAEGGLTIEQVVEPKGMQRACSWRRPLATRNRCQHVLSQIRHYAYPAVATPRVQTLTVACQGDGKITLDIHQPLRASSPYHDSSAVLIYLPRGPLLRNPAHDAATVSALQSGLSYPVVRLNYRASAANQYPGPVHDTLAGYDWIVNHLLPKRAIIRRGRPEGVGRVAVCGELLGGGLATMLAMTECRLGLPGIVAAAVNNPIVDWVFPTHGENAEDTAPTSRVIAGHSFIESRNTHSGMTSRDLLKCRQSLFRKPEHYFDPFASPMLFLRSAGVEPPPAPKEHPPLSEMEQLALLDRDDFHRQQLALSAFSSRSLSSAAQEPSEEESRPPRRKASRNYPSKSLGLRLPTFRINTGSTSPVRDQATELTRLLRKAVIRQNKSASSEFGRKVLLDHEEAYLTEEERLERSSYESEAEKRVMLQASQGLGLWDSSASGKQSMSNAALWLRDELG